MSPVHPITISTNAADRPHTLVGQTTNYITGTQYSPSSGIASLARGNGLTNSLAYNSRLQPTSIQEKRSSDNSVLLNLAPNWVNPSNQNNNGTLWNLSTTANGPPFTQSFGYDALNRLTSASEGSAWSQSYNYDQYGNMWMPPTSNGLPTPAIGSVAPTTNAYVPASGPPTNRNVNSTYDAAGNLTVFASVAITYDANNLQTAAGSNTYAYDGLGQRVSRTVGSAPATYYVYDAFGQLSAEYTAAPLTALRCITCYLSCDHLGSTRMMTDPAAQIVALHDYAPFGQEIPAGVDGRTSLWGSPDSINQKFTGQEHDSETNLDFFHARYMSSGLGRFMSPDPANAGADITNPQSWNAYAYVVGNPLAYRDPSGMSCVYDDDGNAVFDDADGKGCADVGVSPGSLGPDGLPPFGQTSPLYQGNPSATVSADVSQVTTDDIWDFYGFWSSGQLPTTIFYGSKDGMTKALAGSSTFAQVRNQYAARGCRAQDALGSGHLVLPDALTHGNLALIQVGGFQTTANTSGGVTTYSITNTAGQASWSGASTLPNTMAALAAEYQASKATGLFIFPGILAGPLVADGTSDNPYGESGPRHNVYQTFTWAEPSPCGKH